MICMQLYSVFVLMLVIGQGCESVVKIPLRGVQTPSIGPYKTVRTNYYADIGIGNPEKLFQVQIDTSQSHLWVPHFERFKWDPYLHYSQGFQCSKSRTCKKIGKNIKFSSNRADMVCELMDDQVTITGMPNSVQGVKFAAITNIDKNFNSYPVDGFIGLGPEKTTLRGYPSFLATMQTNRKIDLLKFGLWLDQSGRHGELTLGGDDQDRIVQPQMWFKSLSTRSWTLNLQKVLLGSFVFGCPSGNCRVELDSSNNEIYGPAREVQALYQNIGAKVEDGIAYVECRSIPQTNSLTFVIEGYSYPLYPQKFIKQMTSTKCYVSVFPNNEANVWTLGTDFMSSYYTSFDLSYPMISISGTRA